MGRCVCTFPDVESGAIAGLGPVDVGESAQTESVATGGVDVAVHCHRGKAGGDLEYLSNLQQNQHHLISRSHYVYIHHICPAL